jgi:uncharacterized NAD-dependent epimerase/dehydratase family protein
MIATPYLIFLGDAKDALAAKTGQGIVDWRPERVLGQLRFPDCRADLGIADLSLEAAARAGARTLVIGTVSPGGVLPDSWSEVICEAMSVGMDVASGLHTPLNSIADIRDTAVRLDRQLFDVRLSHQTFAVGSGEKRGGKRLLTVGTDCSVGKKYTALALEKTMRSRGMDAEFRATGQTGILIAGGGVAIDAVVADFISGAAEWLSPDAADDHWDVVEGQGSLFHPSFAGVSAGLLHGTQPDAFVVCHEPTRSSMRNVSAPIPAISDVIDLTVRMGSLVNPAIRCAGIAINTHLLSEAEARECIAETASRLSFPATDPLRFGVDEIVDGLRGI